MFTTGDIADPEDQQTDRCRINLGSYGLLLHHSCSCFLISRSEAAQLPLQPAPGFDCKASNACTSMRYPSRLQVMGTCCRPGVPPTCLAGIPPSGMQPVWCNLSCFRAACGSKNPVLLLRRHVKICQHVEKNGVSSLVCSSAQQSSLGAC